MLFSAILLSGSGLLQPLCLANPESEPIGSQTPADIVSPAVSNFQLFVNGNVNIQEAVVYRKITKPSGEILNEEWWRFGYQENTYFVQRLEPASDEPSNLVPLDENEVIGRSTNLLWTASDDNIHTSLIEWSSRSVPDVHGAFGRSLLLCAVSLGLPRSLDAITFEDAPILWEGLDFRSSLPFPSDSGSNRDTEEFPVHGRLVTNPDDGNPQFVSYDAVDTLPGGKVTYLDFHQDHVGIPRRTLLQTSDGTEYLYEFMSLELGADANIGSAGYVPSMFVDMDDETYVMVWSNELPFSVIDGQLQPAFGVDIAGEMPRRGVLLTLLFAGANIGAAILLWYRRTTRASEDVKE